MNAPHTKAATRLSCRRVLAATFILFGAVSTIVALLNAYGSPSEPWGPFSTVWDGAEVLELPHSGELDTIQPIPGEWPIIVAKTPFDSENPIDRYTVAFTPVRGTSLLKLDVTGRSPDHTQALAIWMTDHFVDDLRRSLADHGADRWKPFPRNLQSLPLSGLPSPDFRRNFKQRITLISSLLAPLLLASSVLLFQKARASD